MSPGLKRDIIELRKIKFWNYPVAVIDIIPCQHMRFLFIVTIAVASIRF